MLPGWEHTRGLAEAEVAAPSEEVWPQLDQLRQVIPRVRACDVPCILNLSRAFGAMRRSLPSVEMLNPRNLRSSGRATALFASLIIIETFEPGCQPRLWPIPSIGLDSS